DNIDRAILGSVRKRASGGARNRRHLLLDIAHLYSDQSVDYARYRRRTEGGEFVVGISVSIIHIFFSRLATKLRRGQRAVSDRRQAPLCTEPCLGGDPLVVRVVRVAVTIGSRVRRDPWELLRVIALLAGIIVLPTPTQSASSSPGGSPSAASPNAVGGNALRRVPQTQVFDPAAAQLSSWWSYNAMSVIAPIIYGDFQSPLQLSFSFGSRGVAPMPESEGLDPAVSAVLDSMLEPGLLPGGGSAETAAFGVGSTGIGWSSEGLGWSGAGLGLSSAVPTNSIVGAIPIISTAEG